VLDGLEIAEGLGWELDVDERRERVGGDSDEVVLRFDFVEDQSSGFDVFLEGDEDLRGGGEDGDSFGGSSGEKSGEGSREDVSC